MTNLQVRLLSSALALLAGAVLANTNNVNVNVSLVIILGSGAFFIADYVRSQR